MKKLWASIIIAISLLFVSSCSLFDDIQKNIIPGEFNDFTASVFHSLLAGSELNLHFLFKDQSAFGFEESYTPSLPKPTSSTSFWGSLYINFYFGSVKNYNFDELTFDQQMTYLVLVDLLDSINNTPANSSYLTNDYLGSYLGYQAQLPLLLAEYKFYKEQDIINYFAFIDLIPETFTAYVDFEKEKAEKGYGMPDFIIDKVISQCLKFTGSLEDHFLISTFNEKVVNADFLSSAQKQDYINTNKTKVEGPLREGYEIVRTELASVYGMATNEKGLYYYTENELGKKVYTKAFQEATGYQISVDDAITYLEDRIMLIRNQLISITQSYPNIEDVIDTINLYAGDPYDQLMIFKDLFSTTFPVIDTYPNINIKYIDEAMEDNFSPAAYMTSPLDDFTDEFIYLNNKSIERQGDNYLFTTLAHEGITGHMYQNIYFKSLESVNPIRQVIKNRGYLEGWATYAELFSYDLMIQQTSDVVEQKAIEFMRLYDELNGAIYCLIDANIHYQGWDEFDIANYLGIDASVARSVFEQLVEVYTNPQMYYFTYFKLRDLYQLVQNNVADFDPQVFHRIILECGPVALRHVETVVKNHYQINA